MNRMLQKPIRPIPVGTLAACGLHGGADVVPARWAFGSRSAEANRLGGSVGADHEKLVLQRFGVLQVWGR